MKNNLAKALLLCTLLISCNSSKFSHKAYVLPNLDEDEILEKEINSIRNSKEKKPVKALWSSYLLKEKISDNDSVYSLFVECAENVVDQYLKEEKSIRAKHLEQSLKNCGWTNFDEKKIPDSEILSKLKKSPDAKVNLQQLIKGTVTVYVDKGIKIESGMGHIDAVLGSGFFITKDGYIITNHHVISDMVDKKYEGFSRLYIKLAEDSETRIPAKVIGWDKTLDLALIKTEIEAPYWFALGSSNSLGIGDKVLAIGSPLGLERTLTSGIISSTDRDIFSGGNVFQLDAAVNSGNSGGPMIDQFGLVQGIIFAGVPFYQGLNFAIPVEYLKNEIEFLYEGGERIQPWICSYGKTKRLPGSGTENEGVKILYTMSGGSAALSGIKKDDTIISVNGKKTTTLNQLHEAFMNLQQDSIIKIDVMDEEENISTKIVYLEKRPENPGYKVYQSDYIGDAAIPLLGLKLVSVSELSRRKFKIEEVIKNSLGDTAGFSENDPFEILDITFNKEKDSAFFEISAKKRKNGFLNVTLGLPVSMDSTNYF